MAVEICIENLNKSYGNRLILGNLNFQIGGNGIVGVLGPNGAGKTTLSRILCGVTPASSGKIYINNHPLTTHKDALQALIGYLPEQYELPDSMRVEEFLQFQAHLKQIRDVKGAIQNAMQICDLHPTLKPRFIGTLSQGMKQRVAMALILLNAPQLIILDEPSARLDPQQIENFRELLLKISQKAMVVVATHALEEIESLCKQLLILHQGKLVANGSFPELCQKHFPNKRYQLTLQQTTPTLKESLQSSPFAICCESVTCYPDKTECTFERPSGHPHFESDFNTWLVRNGYPIQEFVEIRPTLRLLFFQLTQFPWKI